MFITPVHGHMQKASQWRQASVTCNMVTSWLLTLVAENWLSSCAHIPLLVEINWSISKYTLQLVTDLIIEASRRKKCNNRGTVEHIARKGWKKKAPDWTWLICQLWFCNPSDVYCTSRMNLAYHGYYYCLKNKFLIKNLWIMRYADRFAKQKLTNEIFFVTFNKQTLWLL